MSDNDKNLDRRMRVRRTAALVALLGAAASAQGQQPAVNSTVNAAGIGRSTDAWLALQRDNRAAGPDLPMLGDAASLAYQRYLDSFKSKIPDSMGSPLGSGGGASSGGQGSAQAY
ncbi:DUF3613 domain-containing protein [Burkholderia ubonensis]|uniref:DUF3613 domain-containing protein n=1 Tax=Burkholderia ubonensis TaxID=101571 RepID=A0AB74D9H6_9BURK|nr:DUF3613 domain-containing protein [Burkholderia ubonensis]PAJ82708.1 hypothetical protein CJO71_02370 [Burkholderia ubonensis]PAJ84783.1 hypothetical protein CJO70_26845 [Burkholderia ubonensis]PAJ93908.1 hypothetical protein CJO69_11800 [Burkholderia ubonensis]PAJ96951.1 hypothetical protein CJO68_32040 [Burkholderia ubonensis]PAK09699.1 hypothetical protein CJO67_01110 [Burkholderia ubonensis]